MLRKLSLLYEIIVVVGNSRWQGFFFFPSKNTPTWQNKRLTNLSLIFKKCRVSEGIKYLKTTDLKDCLRSLQPVRC